MSAARAAIHAMFPLDEQATTELDKRLDAHAAEVRRGDADRLHDERKQYRGRDRFCGGIEHAVGLLKQWAEKTTTPAEAAPDARQAARNEAAEWFASCPLGADTSDWARGRGDAIAWVIGILRNPNLQRGDEGGTR